MATFRCPHCGSNVDVADTLDSSAGGTTVLWCGSCNRSFGLPPSLPKQTVEPIHMHSDQPVAQLPPQPERASPSSQRSVSVSSIEIVLLTILGIGAAGAALGAFNDSGGNFSSNRFKSDNAVGATANAVEYIAQHEGSKTTSATWLIVVLLCWGISKLDGIRVEVARLRSRKE